MAQVFGCESNGQPICLSDDDVVIVMSKNEAEKLLPHLPESYRVIVGKYLNIPEQK